MILDEIKNEIKKQLAIKTKRPCTTAYDRDFQSGALSALENMLEFIEGLSVPEQYIFVQCPRCETESRIKYDNFIYGKEYKCADPECNMVIEISYTWTEEDQ